MVKKKLLVIGALSLSLISCVTASAVTYLSTTLTGTSAESKYVYLGDGYRSINATGKSRGGYARAVRIKSYSPDPVERSVYVSAGTSSSATFKANSYASNGEVQSYYIRWNGDNSSASAYTSFTS